jgi:hypothetical protein
MNGNSVFGIRGAAAWVGGIATALLALACDVEPVEPGVGARASVQDLELEVDDDASAPTDDVAPAPSYPCDRAAHPSVHVVPVVQHDDYFMPAEVDMVWFEHNEQTFEARCIQDEDGDCMAWLAGYEISGPITVSTEYCDNVVSETIEVEVIPGACHVSTEYLLLEVSTRGCLTTEQPEPPEPARWPWDLTTVGASEHPGGHGYPFGRATRLAAWNDVPPPPPPASDAMASPE